jgi:hypothetical protein
VICKADKELMDIDSHIVGDVDVRRTPTQLPGVDGKHEYVKTSLPCSLEEADSL